MGRRKIDIAYLTDDRVRKVTFCKRKGGLFKKADDLSKLCGVEVAVIIIGDKKTCEYASTDMNRIVERYQSMQSGAVRDETSEIARLWTQLETQRREMEALTRELATERQQLEEFRGGSNMLAGVAETNHATALPLPTSTLPHMVPFPVVRPVTTHATMPNMLLSQPQVLLPQASQVNVSQLQAVLQSMQSVAPTVKLAAVVPPTKHERDADANDSDMSEDTAEVDDSNSEGTPTTEVEPALKRRRVEEADAIETCLPMNVNVPVNSISGSEMPGLPVLLAQTPAVPVVPVVD
jgi:hypothetical protein